LGGGLTLLYAQDKTWTWTLVVCSRRVYVLKSAPKEILLMSFDLNTPIDGAEVALGCIQEEGTWHIASVKDGVETYQHWSARTKVSSSKYWGDQRRLGDALSLLSSGGRWSKRTPSGGRYIIPNHDQLSKKRTSSGGGVFFRSMLDLDLPAYLYEGTTMALEGAETRRGVDIWTQAGEGEPIRWWWYNFHTRDALLQKTVHVGEGEVLHDVHPTLPGIVLRGPYTGWRSWTPFRFAYSGWGLGTTTGYAWRRLYHHPQEFSQDQRDFGVVRDSWGRHIVIRSSVPITLGDSSWRPGRYVRKLEDFSADITLEVPSV
jgi:hypothetical protein